MALVQQGFAVFQARTWLETARPESEIRVWLAAQDFTPEQVESLVQQARASRRGRGVRRNGSGLLLGAASAALALWVGTGEVHRAMTFFGGLGGLFAAAFVLLGLEDLFWGPFPVGSEARKLSLWRAHQRWTMAVTEARAKLLAATSEPEVRTWLGKLAFTAEEAEGVLVDARTGRRKLGAAQVMLGVGLVVAAFLVRLDGLDGLLTGFGLFLVNRGFTDLGHRQLSRAG